MKISERTLPSPFGLRKSIFAAGLMLPLSALATDSSMQADSVEKETAVLAGSSKEMAKASPGGTKEEAGKDEAALAPMVVLGGSENPESTYQVETSTAGSKLPLEITQVPQSIQVITSKAFEEQGVLSISDIVKQVPSASIFGSRFTRFPKVNIRGFQAEQTRNGIRQLFASNIDSSALSHIQNIEILKGPGSTTFGQGGDGGGIINVITKM